MRQLRLIAASLSLFSLLTLAPGAFAQTQPLDQICQDTPRASVCKENNKTSGQTAGDNKISRTLLKIGGLLSIFIGVAAVIMIIVGGLKYVLGTGDPAKINSAKNTILFALVGVVVALLARSIIVFVVNRAL